VLWGRRCATYALAQYATKPDNSFVVRLVDEGDEGARHAPLLLLLLLLLLPMLLLLLGARAGSLAACSWYMLGLPVEVGVESRLCGCIGACL
jgi:hypothetical protein